MSVETPPPEIRDDHDGPVTGAGEGLPWQVIYSAFIGVLLSTVGFYGGLYLARAENASLGAALIIASVALAACFVALLAGARWALSVTRIVTMSAIAVMLANLAWLLYEDTLRPEWRLPGARAWGFLVDALFQPLPLMLLAGLAACAFLLCLLLGPTLRRFVARS